MFPLRDINPTRRIPIATYVLIAINILVFLWEQSLSMDRLQEVFLTLSVVPNNISASPFSTESFLDMVRSMFFHGGWAHLGGNMLYLYLFVEESVGAYSCFICILSTILGLGASISSKNAVRNLLDAINAPRRSDDNTLSLTK
jgi:membrane associated rhomboid family serine protease